MFVYPSSCDFSIFFFFKQKTAYEMRISDWSSDVCSSDLRDVDREHERRSDCDRRIRHPQEAVAEARDDVEERVEMADRAECGRQPVDRIEGARQQGERRDDEIGDRGGKIGRAHV